MRGYTVFHSAVASGYTHIVTTLLNVSADMKARQNVMEHSVLDVAVCMGSMEMVKIIVQHGADVNARASSGLTALHKAASSEGSRLINALLGFGAAVDQPDMHGSTPLVVAARQDSVHGVVDLLRHGTSVNARNAARDSPLHSAARSSRDLGIIGRNVAVLLEWDADETAVNADGITAAELVQMRHPFDCAQYPDLNTLSETRPWDAVGRSVTCLLALRCGEERGHGVAGAYSFCGVPTLTDFSLSTAASQVLRPTQSRGILGVVTKWATGTKGPVISSAAGWRLRWPDWRRKAFSGASWRFCERGKFYSLVLQTQALNVVRLFWTWLGLPCELCRSEFREPPLVVCKRGVASSILIRTLRCEYQLRIVPCRTCAGVLSVSLVPSFD